MEKLSYCTRLTVFSATSTVASIFPTNNQFKTVNNNFTYSKSCVSLLFSRSNIIQLTCEGKKKLESIMSKSVSVNCQCWSVSVYIGSLLMFMKVEIEVTRVGCVLAEEGTSDDTPQGFIICGGSSGLVKGGSTAGIFACNYSSSRANSLSSSTSSLPRLMNARRWQRFLSETLNGVWMQQLLQASFILSACLTSRRLNLLAVAQEAFAPRASCQSDGNKRLWFSNVS